MFRGEYKKNNYNGVPINYVYGDTVLFEGNIYEVILPTSKSPFESPNNWSFIGSSTLYPSDTPPINPQLGQQWEKNGFVYTYFFDGNNYSWVQF